MTDDRDLSLILDRWLSDGPTEMPDRVVDVVATGISRQRQRPAWRLDWRRYAMNTNVKLAAGLVAVLAVAIVGYNLLPGSSGLGGQGPAATPTATPSVGPSPSASPVAKYLNSGPIEPGLYETRPFSGSDTGLTVTFTMPGGWEGFPDWSVLGPKGPGGPAGIGIGFLMASGLFSDPCHWDTANTGVFPQPGDVTVGPTVDDLVAALRANTSYVTSAPVDVSIGGFAGKALDIQLPSDVDFATCDGLGGTGGAFLLWAPPVGSENDLYAQGPGNIWHLRIIDVNGSRVIVLVDDFAATPAQDRSDAQAIVDSIQFTR